MVVVHQVGGNNTSALVLHHGTKKKCFFATVFYFLTDNGFIFSNFLLHWIGLDWIIQLQCVELKKRADVTYISGARQWIHPC